MRDASARRSRSSWLLVLLLFSAAPALASSKAAPAPKASGRASAFASQERAQQPFRADVDMVLVDCVVLDDSGAFVHGLTRDDFRLLEEGEEVGITFFSEQHYGAIAPPSPTDPGVVDTPPDEVVGLPRYLVLFIDAYNTSPSEWDRMRPALNAYTRNTLTAGDRVLVAMLMPDGRLRVAPEFTSSPDAIEASLAYIKGNPELRERIRQNEQQLVSSLQTEASGAGGADTAGAAGETTALRMGATLAGFYALQRRDEVLHTLDSLIGLAEHLDRTHDIPGPKTLLFVSGGLPEQPGSNYYYILDEFEGQADPSVRGQPGVGGYNPIMRRSGSDNSVGDYITTTVGKLNRLNYTVYAIDARGAADFGGDDTTSATRTPISREARTQVFQDAQNGLGTIARATGGLAFTGSNNFTGAIAEMHADTAYRYVLGYALPQHDEEDVEGGKFFRVRVEVTRPDVTVRAREGYVVR